MKGFTTTKMHELFGFLWIDKPKPNAKANQRTRTFHESRTVTFTDPQGKKTNKTLVLHVGSYILDMIQFTNMEHYETGAGKVCDSIHPPTHHTCPLPNVSTAHPPIHTQPTRTHSPHVVICHAPTTNKSQKTADHIDHTLDYQRLAAQVARDLHQAREDWFRTM
jgi:hypothetical protein